MKSLDEVNERYAASYKESSEAIVRISLKLTTLREQTKVQKSSIQEFTQELQTMKVNHENSNERLVNIKDEVHTQRMIIDAQKDHLIGLEKQLAANEYSLKDLETRLVVKGEGRIKTFEIPFEKDKVVVIQQAINDTERKISNQRRLLLNLHQELTGMYSPLTIPQRNLQEATNDVEDAKTELILMHKSLNEMLEEMIELMNELAYHEQQTIELKENIENAIDEIHNTKRDDELSASKLQTVEEKKALVETSNKNEKVSQFV